MNLCGISYLYLQEISHISNCIYESRMIYTPLNPSKLIRIHNDKTERNTSLNVFIAMIPRRLSRPPPLPHPKGPGGLLRVHLTLRADATVI